MWQHQHDFLLSCCDSVILARTSLTQYCVSSTTFLNYWFFLSEFPILQFSSLYD